MASTPSQQEREPSGASSEGRKARRIARPTPPDQSHVAELVDFFRSYGRTLTASAGFLGGLFYVLLTWTASWVYSPAGVKPSEVGLGYGSLLVGTAVALVTALAFVLAGIATAFVALWLRQRIRGRKGVLASLLAYGAVVAIVLAAGWWDVANALFLLVPALVFAYLFPRRAYRLVAGAGLILVLVLVYFVVLNNARLAKHDIEQVESLAQYDVFNPWEGHIATVRTSTTKPICGLYLGNADGIGVLVIAGDSPETRRTMRFPLSSATLDIYPQKSLCSAPAVH
jgi:chromate transport protein ChrA